MALFVDSNKKINSMFANVNKQKKNIVSAWVDRDGIPARVFGADKNVSHGLYVARCVMNGSIKLLIFDNKMNYKTLNTDFSCVAFGNGKFVALKNRTSYYSEDGITWTAGSGIGSTSDNIQFVNDKFIALNGFENYKLTYSVDGINWEATGYTPDFASADITYGNGRYIIIGAPSLTTSSTFSYIAYSDDLTNWSKETIYSSRPKQIAFGNKMFVIVFDDYQYNRSIAYSDDGTNWTIVSSDTNGDKISGIFTVSFKGERFIALGYGVSYYSDDGINWNKGLGLSSVSLWKSCYGNNRFYAIGGQTTSYMCINYSDDGINWEKATLNGLSSVKGYCTSFTYGETESKITI